MRIRLWASAVLFIFIAYMWDFEAHLYPTWDDNRNLQILDQMLAGHWQNLYQHAAPAFYLLFLPLAAVATPTGLAFACTVCHLGGLLLAVSLLGRQLALPNGLRIYAFLALALAPISLFTGHSFTVEAPAMLFFWGGVLAAVHRKPWLAGVLLGLAIGINYKALLWTGLLALAYLMENAYLPGRQGKWKMENKGIVNNNVKEKSRSRLSIIHYTSSIKGPALRIIISIFLVLLALSLPAFALGLHPAKWMFGV